MTDKTIPITEAEALVAAALVRCRTGEANAAVVARALVAAEADGLKGHGLSRVASYAAQAKVGKIDGFATPIATQPRPAVLVVDAAHGFAYPALDLAIARLPEITRAAGVASAAIHRSHHAGVAGAPVERLAEQGFVALLFANTPAAMAPWGRTCGRFRHEPDRLRLSSARPRTDRRRSVVVQGGARQHPRRERAWRGDSRGLGARCTRPAHNEPAGRTRRHDGAAW